MKTTDTLDRIKLYLIVIAVVLVRLPFVLLDALFVHPIRKYFGYTKTCEHLRCKKTFYTFFRTKRACSWWCEDRCQRNDEYRAFYKNL